MRLGADEPGLAAEVDERYERHARSLNRSYRFGAAVGKLAGVLFWLVVFAGLLVVAGTAARWGWRLVDLGWRHAP